MSLIILIGLVLFAFARFTVREFPGLRLRSPATLVFGFLFISYVLRPLYILLTGNFGTSFVNLDVESNISQIRVTLLILFVALLCFSASFIFAPSHLFYDFFSKPRTLASASLLRLALIGLLSAVAAATIFRELLALEGGLQSGLQLRGAFYEGRNYLIFIITLYRAAFLTWLTFYLRKTSGMTRGRWLLVVSLWLPTLAFDFVTGGRGELVVYNLIPFFVLVSFSARGASQSRAILVSAVVLGLVILIGYRTLVRDQYTSGETTSNSAALVSSIQNIPEELLAGNETSIFDSFLLVQMRIPFELPYRGVATSINVVSTALVPSAVYNKPERTTTTLTRVLAPAQYAAAGNLTFSAAGDLYFSAGILGVLIGFSMLGFISGALIRSASRAAEHANSMFALCFGWIASASTYSVLRTDLYPLTVGALRLGFLVACLILLTQTVRTTASRREGIAE